LRLILFFTLTERQSEGSTPISELSYDATTHTYNSCLPPTRERSVELIDHLTFLALTLSKEVPDCDAANSLAQGLILLEPRSVQKYVTLYFREWHQHSPVIHKASFCPNLVTLPMLFTVILIGALYSSSREMTDKARDMLFLAERFAFSDSKFTLLLDGKASLDSVSPSQCLQATQAAFLVMQIQLRAGGPDKRKQYRSIMFDQIVKVNSFALRLGAIQRTNQKPQAIRSMSLLNTKSPLNQRFSSFEDFNWAEVALAESKIRYEFFFLVL
jgi:hypothetical protein